MTRDGRPRLAPEVLERHREAVEQADRRIRPHVLETPLLESPGLSAELRATVLLKLENTQATGSFKVRGAMARMLAVPAADRAGGVWTASTGNHGAAVAYAGARLGIRSTVVVPAGASESKLAAIRAWGADLVEHGADSVEAEAEARRRAAEAGVVYISPYNDPEVVAGQGTVAAELIRQADGFDAVVVAVGGGGLVAGIAGYLRAVGHPAAVVGCSPAASPVMYESVQAGRILDLPSEPTLSDGTAGGVEPGAITFPWCRALVDRWHLVAESDIAQAMREAIGRDHQLVEGSAGVALAAARALAGDFRGGRIVVILCGGNPGLATLRRILC